MQRYDAGDPNDATTIADYEYDGKNRRTQKTVTNSGVEDVPNDGGNTTLHYYYDNRWRIIEERNGSNEAVRQYVWGTDDTIVFMDVNGDPINGDDCDPDTSDPNDTTSDARYFVHYAATLPCALTDYAPDPNNAQGRVVERYTWLGDGQLLVHRGETHSEAIRLSSAMGFAYSGTRIPYDPLWQGSVSSYGSFGSSRSLQRSVGTLYSAGAGYAPACAAPRYPIVIGPPPNPQPAPARICDDVWKHIGSSPFKGAVTICNGQGGFVACIAPRFPNLQWTGVRCAWYPRVCADK